MYTTWVIMLSVAPYLTAQSTQTSICTRSLCSQGSVTEGDRPRVVLASGNDSSVCDSQLVALVVIFCLRGADFIAATAAVPVAAAAFVAWGHWGRR